MNFIRSKSRSKSKSISSPKSKSSSTRSSSTRSSSTRSSSTKSSSTTSITPESVLVELKMSNSPNSESRQSEIIFPEPIAVTKLNYDKKISKRMNMLLKKGSSPKHFIGHLYFQSLMYLYFYNKYKTGCFIESNNIDRIQEGVTIRIGTEFNHAKNSILLSFIAEQIAICINKNSPIIIIPIGIIFYDGKVSFGHANLLIYRNNTRELEHFEPHGYSFMGSKDIIINEYMKKFLTNLCENLNELLDYHDENKIVLRNTNHVCPQLRGVQYLEELSDLPELPFEPGGYCGAWSLFFTEMCLKNPTVPSMLIYDAILRETRSHDKNYLKEVIRGYTVFINNKIMKHFNQIFTGEVNSEILYDYAMEDNRKDSIYSQPLKPQTFFRELQEILISEIGLDQIKKDPLYNPSLDLMVKKHSYVLPKYRKMTRKLRKSTSSSELSDTDERKISKLRLKEMMKEKK